MLEMHRLTSEYIEAEDRLRLTGEDQKGNALCLWLTQRLALRVISHLVTELSTHSPESAQNPSRDDDANKLLQEFAQQAAQADLAHQEAVTSTSATRALLIQEVDINRAADGAVGFILKDSAAQTAEKVALGFEPQQLRQWLAILHQQWLLAQWPATVWPEWISGLDSPLNFELDSEQDQELEPAATTSQTNKPVH
jgi:hypothetical protein